MSAGVPARASAGHYRRDAGRGEGVVELGAAAGRAAAAGRRVPGGGRARVRLHADQPDHYTRYAACLWIVVLLSNFLLGYLFISQFIVHRTKDKYN